MMICPSGHQSEAEDYCDTCGSPIDASAQSAVPAAPAANVPAPAPVVSGPPASAPPPPQAQPCPHCQVKNTPDALFCEACGYDFTTGTMPRAASFDPFSLPSDDAAATGAEGPKPQPATAAPASAPLLPAPEPVHAHEMTAPTEDEAAPGNDVAQDDGTGDRHRAGDSGVGAEQADRETHDPAAEAPPRSWAPVESTPAAEQVPAPEAAPAVPETGAAEAVPAAPKSAAPDGAVTEDEYETLEAYAVTTLAAAPAEASPAATLPPDEAGLVWVAEVWVDPDWYRQQKPPDPMPSPGLPTIVALRKKSVLIGRESHSRNISPDIDCDTDPGASRRQAQLTTDGTRWWVEDLDSANGTYVSDPSEGLPDDPVKVGQRHELLPDDRIYLGAWTRLVIRKATEEEIEAYA